MLFDYLVFGLILGCGFAERVCSFVFDYGGLMCLFYLWYCYCFDVLSCLVCCCLCLWLFIRIWVFVGLVCLVSCFADRLVVWLRFGLFLYWWFVLPLVALCWLRWLGLITVIYLFDLVDWCW